MTKNSSDDILERLYKLRIRESERLKTVLECCTFSILTPILAQGSSIAHSPTHTESEAVAPRYTWETGTTTQSPSRCSAVLPSSRMSSANTVLAQEPSLRPSSSRRARRRDPGKLRIRPSQVHPAVPGKARLQGLILNPHGQTMGKPANVVLGSTLRQLGCLLG